MSVREEDPVEALAQRYLELLRAGKAPSPAAYAAQTPDCREELEELLTLMVRLEDIGNGAAVGAAGQRLKLPMDLGQDLRLTECIGSGGMGTVYKARQRSLGRYCAIKLLNRSLAEQAEERTRFMREARLIARLHHPNIVSVYSAGTQDGFCYYVMDLIEGPALRSLCTSPEAVARIGLKAASALAYAHSCGILHCDIKPSNLLAEADGTVRLSDFGLAQLQGEPEDDAGGTLRYMAPERLRREPFSEAADQYALGMTLRELLAGEPLMAGHSATELRTEILHGHLPALPESCPPDLAAVVCKMTATTPAHRYPSVRLAAEDLRNFLEHRPVAARRTPTLQRLVLWAKRKPAAAVACGLALLCAVVAVAALAVGYISVSEARRRAEASAAVANETLNRVFHHIDRTLPTKAGTDLLAGLLPYYTRMVSDSFLPSEKLNEAYAIIGAAALRSGRADLAAQAYGSLYTGTPSANAGNCYAMALTRSGKRLLARQIDRSLVERYAESPDPNERLAAVSALQRMAQDAPSTEMQRRILAMLDTLHGDLPENPDILFQLANTLSKQPGGYAYGSERTLEDLYTTLSRKYPEVPKYGMRLLTFAASRLRRASTQKLPLSATLTDNALAEADRLLGRWFGDAQVTTTVLRFWLDYARHLRAAGSMARIQAFSERLFGVLNVLYYNAETPDDAREFLIELMLERLQQACNGRDFEGVAVREKELRKKLKSYRGRRREHYRHCIDTMMQPLRRGKQ